MERELEFRNNGIVDSLTRSMAPELFYQSLGRELANGDRDGRPVSLILLRLEWDSPEDFNVVTMEISLVALAFYISQLVRGGEFFSRISNVGFWIAIRGDLSVAQAALDRILESLHLHLSSYEDNHIAVSGSDQDGIEGEGISYRLTSHVIQREPNEDLLQFLNRADRLHFQK